MDTGMPPGEHPNSDVPDPDVVEEAERENSPNPSEDELNRRYRPGGEPSGPDPVEEPARPDAAKADDES